MNQPTTDRRIRKTKQRLRQSLTELLAQKPLSKITVQELTERADVNRGTFYSHYKDISDMKEQIERELFIASGTLKAHIQHIYVKCGVHSRMELMDAFDECWMEGVDT